MTVTIVSDDAERLVREGGVVNDRHDAPHDAPFEAWIYERVDHCTCCGLDLGLGWEHESGCGHDHVGPVRVVDVHHADECEGMYPDDKCHPDAESDRWHWTVEPTGAS